MIRAANGEPRPFLDLTDREAYAIGAFRISQLTNLLASPLLEISTSEVARNMMSFGMVCVFKWNLRELPPSTIIDSTLKHGKFCFTAQKFTATESYDISCKHVIPFLTAFLFAEGVLFSWSLGSALYLARQVGIERPIGGCLSVALRRQAVAAQRCFTHCQRMNESRRINACWRTAQEALSACLGRVWGRISRWF